MSSPSCSDPEWAEPTLSMAVAHVTRCVSQKFLPPV
jgi:hypothetical protein